MKDKQSTIYDKDDHSKIIPKTNMLQNGFFSFNIPHKASTTLNVAYDDSSWLWNIKVWTFEYERLEIVISQANGKRVTTYWF